MRVLVDTDVLVAADRVLPDRSRSRFLWRPVLRDADDEMVLEVAVDGRTGRLLTFNERDFAAADRLGVVVDRPAPCVAEMEKRMTQANYALRLQVSLKAEAERLAKAEGTTLNQFINVAVAEKIAALRTADFFWERARRADLPAALALLDRLGADEPPRPGHGGRVIEMERRQAPCAECRRDTLHNILFVKKRGRNLGPEFDEKYELLQCGGCDSVSMACSYLHSDDPEITYYPSATDRHLPSWELQLYCGGATDEVPTALMGEIYRAVSGRQHRLAAMGIRSFLEHVIAAKVGDHGCFAKNLSKFHEAGYVSTIQHDTLAHLIEAGHAAVHRAFKPTEDELNAILDIIEGVVATIYIHKNQAEDLSKSVPPRRAAKP
jgi:hypothetical protein